MGILRAPHAKTAAPVNIVIMAVPAEYAVQLRKLQNLIPGPALQNQRSRIPLKPLIHPNAGPSRKKALAVQEPQKAVGIAGSIEDK